MSDEPRDPELEGAFAELRRRDAERAPPFAPMWRPRRKRATVVWLAAPAVTVAAAAAALVLWIGVRRDAEPAPPPAAAAVAAASAPDLRVAMEPDPLGFLLEQPATANLDADPRRLR